MPRFPLLLAALFVTAGLVGCDGSDPAAADARAVDFRLVMSEGAQREQVTFPADARSGVQAAVLEAADGSAVLGLRVALRSESGRTGDTGRVAVLSARLPLSADALAAGDYRFEQDVVAVVSYQAERDGVQSSYRFSLADVRLQVAELRDGRHRMRITGAARDGAREATVSADFAASL